MSLVIRISHKNWIARTFKFISILNISKLFIDFLFWNKQYFKKFLKIFIFLTFTSFHMLFHAKEWWYLLRTRIIIITRFGELLNTWRNVSFVIQHLRASTFYIEQYRYWMIPSSLLHCCICVSWRMCEGGCMCVYACILRNG